jgi:DnaJ-class molecular chaperone
MAEDFYKTLGVSRDASQADIQKAYRKLARKYHPDMNPDDKTAKKKFQEVQAAFDVLNDSKKREMYDRYGSSFETAGGPQPGGWGPGGPAGPGGFPGGAPGGFKFEDIDLSQFVGERFGQEIPGGLGDIFSQFRRAAGGRQRKQAAQPRQGGDLHQEMQIPFATAINGGEVQIAVQRPSGQTDTISVRIPVGIEDGKKIRIRGQGEAGPRGGKPGDILLTIHLAPHPYFQRRGNHLHVKVPITLGEAVMGAKIDIPSPRGTVTLNVPACTSSGTKLRIKGLGVAPRNGTPGDLLAEMQIVIPKDLSQADREAIQKIDQQYTQSPRKDLHW